ncbi:hypothetical protein JCM11641_004624 [Rhodosporidiobolus odoratus]
MTTANHILVLPLPPLATAHGVDRINRNTDLTTTATPTPQQPSPSSSTAPLRPSPPQHDLIPWTIQTKYYTADVAFRTLDLDQLDTSLESDDAEQEEQDQEGEEEHEPAILILVQSSPTPPPSLPELLGRLAARQPEFDVALLVTIPAPSSSCSSAPDIQVELDESAWDDVALESGFEWVNLARPSSPSSSSSFPPPRPTTRQLGIHDTHKEEEEEDDDEGLPRLKAALEAHLWSNLERLPQLPQVTPPPPPPPPPPPFPAAARFSSAEGQGGERRVRMCQIEDEGLEEEDYEEDDFGLLSEGLQFGRGGGLGSGADGGGGLGLGWEEPVWKQLARRQRQANAEEAGEEGQEEVAFPESFLPSLLQNRGQGQGQQPTETETEAQDGDGFEDDFSPFQQADSEVVSAPPSTSTLATESFAPPDVNVNANGVHYFFPSSSSSNRPSSSSFPSNRPSSSSSSAPPPLRPPQDGNDGLSKLLDQFSVAEDRANAGEEEEQEEEERKEVGEVQDTVTGRGRDGLEDDSTLTTTMSTAVQTSGSRYIDMGNLLLKSNHVRLLPLSPSPLHSPNPEPGVYYYTPPPLQTHLLPLPLPPPPGVPMPMNSAGYSGQMSVESGTLAEPLEAVSREERSRVVGGMMERAGVGLGGRAMV